MLKEELRGAASPQRLRLTSLGGLGVLPRLWSVLQEGLQGVAVPNGLATLA